MSNSRFLKACRREPVDVALPQIAPGVYESQLGELPSGAYAVRVTQTKPGTSALGQASSSGNRRMAPTIARRRGGSEPLAPAEQRSGAAPLRRAPARPPAFTAACAAGARSP